MLTVVTGSVCAGKSTFVREHAKPGDIVIDLDALAVALGSDRDHGHADALRYVAVKARAAAINEAVKHSTTVDVWIVDSCPAAYRVEQYDRYGAQWVRLDVPLDELHRRADAAGRPPEWHRYIDEWAPTKEAAGPSWNTPWPQSQATPKRWPKRAPHRRGDNSHRYAVLRAQFLADRTNCESCGEPFVTDAPCEHRACKGKGCHFHPLYPTVDHTVRLADGGPVLDVSTWRALCYRENSADGGRFGGQRRRARAQERERDQTVQLDW